MTTEVKKRGRKPAAAAEPKESIRDERGLLKGVDHPLVNPYTVDWRKMINPEYVVLNRAAMAKLSVDTKLISAEETARLLSEVSDDKKIVKLAGFRELLRIRGYSALKQTVKAMPDGLVCECTITFLPNFETDGREVSYTAVAGASPTNVAPEYSQFLAAIASNRAFGRCVREFLGINSVTDEELNPNEEVKVADAASKPVELVKKRCVDAGISFETLLKGLNGQGLSHTDWVSFETLPASVALSALELIKEMGKK